MVCGKETMAPGASLPFPTLIQQQAELGETKEVTKRQTRDCETLRMSVSWDCRYQKGSVIKMDQGNQSGLLKASGERPRQLENDVLGGMGGRTRWHGNPEEAGLVGKC